MQFLEALAQSVSTLRRYLGLQKVAPALELIKDELGISYNKVVLFCCHTEVAAMLAAELDNCVTIVGATPKYQRQRALDMFQNDCHTTTLVANIQAAGIGIDLTAASNVIFVEREWVPAANDQALDRLNRIGQTEPVYARYLTVANSIDQKINDALCRKSKEIRDLLA